jgi:uncharacterized protein VirK/YbjX
MLSTQPGLRGKMMLLLGVVTHPIQTRRWLRFLRRDTTLWALAKSHPRLSLKIYRPYLSTGLTCSGRVSVLIQHYRLMLARGFGDFVRQAAIRPKTICAFSGKSGAMYQLELSCANMDNREGEFFLHLITNNVSLYRAAFAFFALKGENYVKIGCVQGMRADDGASHVRIATRDLYGCRPKNLLVSVVRDIGDFFGCKGMVGICNENRVVANHAHRQPIAPDYDQTWEEMDAVKKDDGDFYLPCTGILKTSFEDVQSKKRSEAKKKNALLESIFRSVRNSLDKERDLGVKGDATCVSPSRCKRIAGSECVNT